MSFEQLTSPQTAVLLQNNNSPAVAGWGYIDAQSGLVDEVTVLVTEQGTPTSYSIDVVIGNVLNGPAQVWTTIQTITGPGRFKVALGGHARYVSAALTAYSGSGSVSVTASAMTAKK